MRKQKKAKSTTQPLAGVPIPGTQIEATKNQGYQLPLFLWQDLVQEVARRKMLGLKYSSQNAIAVVGITQWLEKNKGLDQ